MKPVDKDGGQISGRANDADIGQPELLARLVSTDWRERQEAIETLARLDRPDLARAVLAMVQRQHTDLSVLGGALQLLARIGQPLVDDLADMLQGPDRELRIYVPLALGQLGGPAAVRALLTAVSDEQQPENVRFNAIEALGKLHAEGAEAETVAILRQLLHNGSPFLHYAAVIALGEIVAMAPASAAAPPFAAESLADELLPLLANGYLAEPAVTALAQVGSPESAPRIARSVASWLEKPSASPILAVSALALLERRFPNSGVPEVFLSSIGEQGSRLLLGLVDTACGGCSPDNPFWADLARVLSWLPGGTGRCELTRLLAYPHARALAEKALSAAPDGCLGELTEALRGADAEQTYAAARLLGRCVEPDTRAGAAAALVDALHSDDDILVALAAEGLGRLGALEAIQPLLAALGHPAAQVRREAAVALTGLVALGGLPAVTLAEQVSALSASENPLQRAAALGLLVTLEAPSALGASAADAVLAALDDESFEVRRTAVELLPQLSDPRAWTALQNALSSPDANLRRTAVQGCAELPSEQALPLLARAVHDENGWVRMHAVRGLGNHARPESLPILYASLDDPLPPVRSAAVEALASLDPTDYSEEQRTALREKLRRMTQDPDEEVRRLASAKVGSDTGKGVAY